MMRGKNGLGQYWGMWHWPTNQCYQPNSDMRPYVKIEQVNHPRLWTVQSSQWEHQIGKAWHQEYGPIPYGKIV
jgi:hypothetical protein